MATEAELNAFRSVIDGLSAVAIAQIKALLLEIDDPNPLVVRDRLLASYPELLEPFLSGSSLVASQWYSELRAAVGVDVAFFPRTIDMPPRAQVDAQVRYALTPLFRPLSFEQTTNVLTVLAGSATRMIADWGRLTIEQAAEDDPVSVSYRRVARPGACDFCKMLAGRGAVYRSEAAAGAVIGRGLDESATLRDDGTRKVGGQAKGVRERGVRAIGAAFHDHCRCVVEPTFYRLSDDTINFGRGAERYLVPYSVSN